VFAQFVHAVRFSDGREFLELLNTYWLLKEYQTIVLAGLQQCVNVGIKRAMYGLLLDKPKPETTERKPLTESTLFIRMMQ
jgi:hypothetical protein